MTSSGAANLSMDIESFSVFPSFPGYRMPRRETVIEYETKTHHKMIKCQYDVQLAYLGPP